MDHGMRVGLRIQQAGIPMTIDAEQMRTSPRRWSTTIRCQQLFCPSLYGLGDSACIDQGPANWSSVIGKLLLDNGCIGI